jgi:hypothetical protein
LTISHPNAVTATIFWDENNPSSLERRANRG